MVRDVSNDNLSDFYASEMGSMQNGLVSLKALVSYVANKEGVSEETVLAMVTAQFDVDALEAIPCMAYDAVVRYLVDLKPHANVN